MADQHLPHGEREADTRTGAAEVRHEQTDVNVRGVLSFAVALFVVGVVVHVLIALLFVFFNGRETRSQTVQYPLAVEQEQRLPPAPRLQTNPRQDLLDMRAAEQEILTTYGWADKNAGVVRIPIDAAMKLTLQRGLPARQERK